MRSEDATSCTGQTIIHIVILEKVYNPHLNGTSAAGYPLSSVNQPAVAWWRPRFVPRGSCRGGWLWCWWCGCRCWPVAGATTAAVPRCHLSMSGVNGAANVPVPNWHTSQRHTRHTQVLYSCTPVLLYCCSGTTQGHRTDFYNGS